MTARAKAAAARAAVATTSSAAETIEAGRQVIEIERDAVAALAERIGDQFVRAVEIVLACERRLVVTGMGKSGQICRKLAATFASTGTSSFFVHAAEAAHGDLGMLAKGDACLAISNSGTTRELVDLLPSLKRLRIPVIAMTGGLDSPLAAHADVVLDVSVAAEACPLGLAPTASTTATLALGDALAVAVLERRGFGAEDFARLHPGGALGRRLLKVGDLMHPGAEVPCVMPSERVKRCLEIMTAGGLGVAAVVDADGALMGVITDGDVRRGVLGRDDFSGLEAREAMTTEPKTVPASALATEALAIMEDHKITSLFIVDPQSGAPVGIVHLHDLLRAQIA